MKTKVLFLFAFLLLTIFVQAQNVAINSTGTTANASAMLDVSSTNSGVLIPRLALTGTTSAAPVTAPATSLVVYNTATVSDVTPGFYFWNGSAWVRFLTGASNAWNLTGNAGINPATNFIGTTDAQPWIVRTNNTERYRVLSGGATIFNGTAAYYSTDLVEAQGNATFPDAINGFTDQASGSGVYGGHSNANGIAVIGQNAVTNGAGTGVGGAFFTSQTGGTGVMGTMQSSNFFSACAVSGVTVNTLAGGKGIIGGCDNATGVGVQGQTAGNNGYGVVGINSATAGTNNGIGVLGQTAQSGNGAGAVWGQNSNNAGDGVVGINSAAASTGVGMGVYGQTSQSGSGAAGVYGLNNNAAGTALIGINSATTGTNFGDAIYGQTAQSGGAGLYAFNTHTTGTGVMTGGNNVATVSYLTNGSGGAFTGNTIGTYGYALSTAAVDRFGGYFADASGDYAYIGGRLASGTVYKVIGSGTVSTIVSDISNKKVTMACPEAPEILFMDFGHAQLVNGHAHVTIDPTFAKNILVDDQHPLKVFIQLEGNCNGVYVSGKSANGFDVTELMNGNSNTPFTYQIVAQRANEYDESGNLKAKYVTGRFWDAPLPLNTTTKPQLQPEIKIKTASPDIKASQPMEIAPVNKIKK